VQQSRESHKHLVGNPERGEPRLARRDEGLALVAVLIAFIAIGAAPAAPPDPWDIGAYPFGTLPNDVPAGVSGGDCDDNGIVQPSPIDEDGDGVANQEDPSCIKLSDGNGNGICDSRTYFEMGLESDPDYQTDGCTGWE